MLSQAWYVFPDAEAYSYTLLMKGTRFDDSSVYIMFEEKSSK